MSSSKLQPTLQNDLVTIRPLTKKDFDSLYEVAKDPKIWEQHTDARYKKEVFTRFFDQSLKSGGALIVIDKRTDEVIGTSRYNTLDGTDDAIEIGWTFLARKYWGGTFNRAIKTLLIEHAFNFYDDVLFYIDKENIRSQKAMEKIGGIRLSEDDKYHKIRRDNRDVTFCIKKSDWVSKAT
jgi:RimJ/RimL family protein N-acetyltransferase